MMSVEMKAGAGSIAAGSVLQIGLSGRFQRDANPARTGPRATCGSAFLLEHDRLEKAAFAHQVKAARHAFPDRALVHDPEKWKPVFGKDHAQTEA